MPRSTDFSGGFGFKVQVLPELKITKHIKGEVTRNESKGASADVGGLTTTKAAFPPQAGAPSPEEGVKAGQLYYRAGQSSGPKKAGEAADDDGDDDNAKGGLIKKVKGPKPKGSKDDGKINAQRGEFVIRKAAVQKYGPAKMAAVNSGKATITIPKTAPKKVATKSAAPRRR